MISKTRFSTTLATLAVASLVLVGCSSAPKEEAADAKTEKTEQVAAQSTAEACDIVKDSMQNMSNEISAAPGESGETGALEDQRRVVGQLVSDADKITNSDVSKSFSGYAETLLEMVKFNEEQAKASADTGTEPETLNDTNTDLFNKMSENLDALQALCGW